LAKDWLGKGQDQAAEAEVKKALVFDPNNEEAHLVYGFVYLMRAIRNTALMERDNCLVEAERAPLAEQVDGAMRAAGEHFDSARKLAPDYGEAWMNRGVVAMHFGDWHAAIGFLGESLRNGARLTSEALARANLGWAEFHNDDLALAKTELLRATQLMPNLCLARYRLGEVLFAQGGFEEALSELEPFGVDGASPDDASTMRCRPVLEAFELAGRASVRIGDLEGAVTWYERCAEAAPRSCLAKTCCKALEQLGHGGQAGAGACG
jgi:tetratricopeptide (TPR) repeat protein